MFGWRNVEVNINPFVIAFFKMDCSSLSSLCYTICNKDFFRKSFKWRIGFNSFS